MGTLVDLNFKVPADIRRDFKLATVMNGETMSAVIIRLVQGYVRAARRQRVDFQGLPPCGALESVWAFSVGTGLRDTPG